MLKKNSLKLCSLIFGYILWSHCNSSHVAEEWFDVPVCFYNTDTSSTLKAPETIRVCISGTRSALRTLHKQDTAIHIDAENFNQGANAITVHSAHLLLPSCVKLIDTIPSALSVYKADTQPELQPEACIT